MGENKLVNDKFVSESQTAYSTIVPSYLPELWTKARLNIFSTLVHGLSTKIELYMTERFLCRHKDTMSCAKTSQIWLWGSQWPSEFGHCCPGFVLGNLKLGIPEQVIDGGDT